ncbi:sorting nexin-20 isoform X1 [Salarias fasciatus]|uniref:sorting nexin-20 isoform X1 n=1 Tax=Salarias fasciatus TaxID=181472 RepID=UPI0011767B79|nr:sorting nexin-20-like isoform X1 [Salarias fasciatus]
MLAEPVAERVVRPQHLALVPTGPWTLVPAGPWSPVPAGLWSPVPAGPQSPLDPGPRWTLTRPCLQVYTVVVMRSGRFDSRQASVQRRYSDFRRLHQELRAELQEELEEAPLPPRLLTGNFSAAAIAARRLALQDYLAALFSARRVRRSPRFAAFFTEAEQRRAHGLLRSGRFRPAAEQLQAVLEVQEKLLPWQGAALTVPALCALAVCHRDLDEPERAFAAAQRALPAARRYGPRSHRAALLDALLDLGYRLGRPVAQLQDELTALRDAERGPVAPRSLKELVVQEFL